MRRGTSTAAYNAISANGTLSKMRQVVYDHLLRFGPLTQTQINTGLKSDLDANPSYHKRISELVDQGVVGSAGVVLDLASGMMVHRWAVIPGAVPVKFKRPPSLFKQMKDALKKYGQHLPDCRSTEPGQVQAGVFLPCTCGLAEMLLKSTSQKRVAARSGGTQ
jgi:hypothetical protein